jgi:hypothetical protein
MIVLFVCGMKEKVIVVQILFIERQLTWEGKRFRCDCVGPLCGTGPVLSCEVLWSVYSKAVFQIRNCMDLDSLFPWIWIGSGFRMPIRIRILLHKRFMLKIKTYYDGEIFKEKLTFKVHKHGFKSRYATSLFCLIQFHIS